MCDDDSHSDSTTSSTPSGDSDDESPTDNRLQLKLRFLNARMTRPSEDAQLNGQSTPACKLTRAQHLQSVAWAIGRVFVGLAGLCWTVCPPTPQSVIGKCALRPPPRSYDFVSVTDGRRLSAPPRRRDRLLDLRVVARDEPTAAARDDVDCFFVRTARGNWVACAYVCTVEAPRRTLLFSQPNATDLGHYVLDAPLRLSMQDASACLRCAVAVYDYSGYGLSSGQCAVANVAADARAVLAALQRRYGLASECVVLWGFSLGTVASTLLASEQPNVAGLILTAPLLSACRAAFGAAFRPCGCDEFESAACIERVRCPTLICHGCRDELLTIEHGIELYRRCPVDARVRPLWLPEATHLDMEFYPEYWQRLRSFIWHELRPLPTGNH